MARTSEKSAESSKKRKQSAPARTLEARERQLINYAVDEAERRLKNGTASSQIITTLLHLATTKAQLEMEKLRADVEVSSAKVKEMESRESSKELYERAITAFRSYSGQNMDDYEDDEDLY